jgi:hypothetical protein
MPSSVGSSTVIGLFHSERKGTAFLLNVWNSAATALCQQARIPSPDSIVIIIIII